MVEGQRPAESVGAAVPAATAQTWTRQTGDAPEGRAWTVMRLGLLVAWIALAVAGAVTGERHAPRHELLTALASGQVTALSVSGQGVGPDDSGAAEQRVHWTACCPSGWRLDAGRRVTVITVATLATGDDTSDGDWRAAAPAGTHPWHAADAGDYLTDRYPGLAVRHDRADPQTWRGPFGWWIPQRIYLPLFVVQLAAFIMIISGPTPWRATRWAWFWLGLAPIGIPAFLLLSGPTPLIRRPRDVHHMILHGGWAFVMAVLVHVGRSAGS